MKRVYHLILVTTLLFKVVLVFGQDKMFDNGLLVYKMDLKRNDATYGNVSITSDMRIMILGRQMKTTTSTTIMGMTMTITYVINKETKNGVVLVQSPQGNFGALITPADYLDFTNNQAGMVDGGKVSLTSKTQTILGYTAKQAFVTNEDGVEAEIYYTKALGNIPDAETTGLGIKGVEGIPLSIGLDGADGSMHFDIVSIAQGNIQDSQFVYEIPAGYQQLAYSELAASN